MFLLYAHSVYRMHDVYCLGDFLGRKKMSVGLIDFLITTFSVVPVIKVTFTCHVCKSFK